MTMREDMAYILLDREKIARRVSEMGALLSRDYAGKRPLLICVLKGSVISSNISPTDMRTLSLYLWVSLFSARMAAARRGGRG